MERLYKSISFAAILSIYPFCITLLPVLFVPFIGVDSALQKGLIAAGALASTVILGGLAFLVLRGESKMLLRPLQFIGIPLCVVAAFSSFQVASPEMAWWGIGLEEDTVGFLFLFAVALFTASFLSKRSIRIALFTFVGSVSVATMYTLISYVADPSTIQASTIAGSWISLSFLIAGALLVVALLIDAPLNQHRTNWIQRAALIAFLVVLILGLILFFNKAVVYGVLTLFIPFTALLIWRRNAYLDEVAFPFGSAGMTLVLVLFVFFGFQTPIDSLPADIRPSLLLTELIVVPLYFEEPSSVVFGTGPGTFPLVWERYRPIEFNRALIWDTSFNAAYNTVATLTITLGVLGFMAFLACPVALLVTLWRRVALSSREFFVSTDSELIGASLALVLFSIVALFVATPGPVLFLMGGVALGFSSRLLSLKGITLNVGGNGFLVRTSISMLCIGCAGVLLWVSLHQLFAAEYHARGVEHLELNAVEAAEILEKGADIWPISFYERDASRAVLSAAFAVRAANISANPEAFEKRVTKAVALADRACESNPDDSAAWISRASLYLSIGETGVVPNWQERARESLGFAKSLAPNSPEVSYLYAVLAVMEDDSDEARRRLDESLKLKSDYTSALQLREQLSAEPTP